MSDYPPVVIDNGASTIKAGFAGNDAPTVVFPSIVGFPRRLSILVNSEKRNHYVGEAAQNMRGVLSIVHPLSSGVVDNWDSVEKLWYHTFHTELKVEPEEHSILMTEAPFNSRANRERMASSLFETFNFRAMYIALSPLLSFYASGQSTGIVVECGADVCDVVPVQEYRHLPHYMCRLGFAGNDVDAHLSRMLAKKGLYFLTTAEQEIVRDIKERHSYIPLDCKKEIQTSSPFSLEKQYELPDGQVVTIGSERLKCGESLFNPSLMGKDVVGLHKLVFNCISKLDNNMQTKLFKMIILSGGTTMFRGFPDRMKKELSALTSSKVDIVASRNRKYNAWIGGSIVASTNSFQHMWVSRQEYFENGSNIIYKSVTQSKLKRLFPLLPSFSSSSIANTILKD